VKVPGRRGVSLMPKTSVDRILDTMIELSQCSVEQRIILAGAAGSRRIPGWRRRGYCHVVTTATCRLRRGQYNMACVEWRRHSIKALEATLDWLVHFLSATGVLVIWIDAAISTARRRQELQSAIERFGFHVETATRCENGFAVSARRLAISRQTVAA
jgi:hypothetical protein